MKSYVGKFFLIRADRGTLFREPGCSGSPAVPGSRP
jgi:hypothetical protein